MSLHRSAILLFLGSLLFGCAGPSVLIQGTNTLVRYRQIDKHTGKITLELVMVEEDHAGFRDLYSMEREDANIKIIPEERFKRFLQVLEDLGFLDIARPLPKGTPPRYGKETTKALVVENDSGQWVAMNGRHLTLDQYKQFRSMVDLFRNCYDSVVSLQAIKNEKGEGLFLEEQRRLRERRRKIPDKEQ